MTSSSLFFSSSRFSRHFSPHASRPARSAQAAVEFLSTYGFALLGLLITLGAINYFGFFNPSTLRSSDCLFPRGIECRDYIINQADPGSGVAPYLRLALTNEYPVNITVTGASLSTLQYAETTTCTLVPAGSWGLGEQRTLWCRIPDAVYGADTFYQGAVRLNFTQYGGSYPFSVSGRFSVRAQ
jgi:hypothetical protein